VRETVSITSGWSVPCQELRAADLLGLRLEYVDEQRADRLALFSGSVVLASALQQHGDDAGVHAP
jgi:hypothetical protein